MEYEEKRTSEVVDRLVKVGNAARAFSVVAGTILLGGLLAVTGRLLVGPSLGWILGFIGAVTGYVMGGYAARVLEVTFEWMAQLLLEVGYEGRTPK